MIRRPSNIIQSDNKYLNQSDTLNVSVKQDATDDIIRKNLLNKKNKFLEILVRQLFLFHIFIYFYIFTFFKDMGKNNIQYEYY